jgi:16S rRNA (adenine1518-N6/adenine1519-N6)-dimethyltransferase
MKRRKLGQHYLVDEGVAMLMVKEAGVRPDEKVLEIGTGKGVLTKMLVKLGSEFEGFEVDPDNVRATMLAVGRNVAVHLGDAFAQPSEFDVLVSSLPYSRSMEFVEWLAKLDYKRAVVLLQEEFAFKIMAHPGSRDYRAVSVLAQMTAEMRIAGRVPKESFRPQPKVASVVVVFSPRRRLSDLEVARVKILFSLRRRKASGILPRLGIHARRFGDRRVLSLTPEEAYEVVAE